MNRFTGTVFLCTQFTKYFLDIVAAYRMILFSYNKHVSTFGFLKTSFVVLYQLASPGDPTATTAGAPLSVWSFPPVALPLALSISSLHLVALLAPCACFFVQRSQAQQPAAPTQRLPVLMFLYRMSMPQ